MKNNHLPLNPNGAPIIALAGSDGLDDRRDIALIALERTRMPMAISDPRLPDNPVVLANQAFLDLCGYEAADVIGRNCRFLQGPDTDPLSIAELRSAVSEEREAEVELLNYRKDGSAFWNRVLISPIHNDGGKVVYFFASQKDETERHRAAHLEEVERRLLLEVDHRTKNALALVQSIVVLSQKPDIQSFAASVEGRVGSIVKSHGLLADSNWGEVPLRRIFETAGVSDETGIATFAGPDVTISAPLVQPLALIFHEIFDNATKHGAMSVDDGHVHVTWHYDQASPEIQIMFRESGGPPPAERRQRGLGSRLIEQRLPPTWGVCPFRIRQGRIKDDAVDPDNLKPRCHLAALFAFANRVLQNR